MRAPWIWRQKQAQTPSTRESSMRCQPLCGASLWTAQPAGLCGLASVAARGWAAFTRRGSADSHDSARRRGSGAWLERVFVRIKVNFRADHYLWDVACPGPRIPDYDISCNTEHSSLQNRPAAPAGARAPARRPLGAATQPGRVTARHRSAWRGRPHRHPHLPACRPPP